MKALGGVDEWVEYHAGFMTCRLLITDRVLGTYNLQCVPIQIMKSHSYTLYSRQISCAARVIMITYRPTNLGCKKKEKKPMIS